MPEERKYPRSGRRSILSASDLLDKVGESALVCVPIASLEIARGLVRDRGYWRTTYAMEYFNSHYTLPNDEEFDTITAFLDQFLEATTVMDCNDFINELDDIGKAIEALSKSGGCGCGSHGAGSTSPPASTTDTGDIYAETGTPPDGYADWAAYQVAKCDIATYIVDSLLSDVRYYQTVQIANLTVGALATGMIAIASGFTLTAILAGLLAILAYSVAVLVEAEEQIEDGFDDLVCAILSGETAQESLDNYVSEMTTQMTAKVADPISEFLIIQALTVWADTAFFNLLYADLDYVLSYSIPGGANCSACGLGCSNFQINQGAWLGGLTFESEVSGIAHYISFFWNTGSLDCTDDCGPMEDFTVTSLPGWTPKSATNDSFRVWSDAACPITSSNADVYSSDTQIPLDTHYCGRYINFFSATPFTASFERFGHCF